MNYSSKKKFFFIFAIISVLFIYSALNIKFTDAQDFKFHVFTVKFEYYGMDPVAIEKIITKPLEEKLCELDSIYEIKSTCRFNESVTSLWFYRSCSLNLTYLKIRKITEDLYNRLPGNVQKPQIYNSSSEDKSIICISMDCSKTILEKNVKPQLQSVVGVSEVIITGKDRQNIEITFDNNRIANYLITPSKIADSVSSFNTPNLITTQKSDKYISPFFIQNRINDREELSKIQVLSNENPVYLTSFSSVNSSVHKNTELELLNNTETAYINIKTSGNSNKISISDKCHEILGQNEFKKFNPVFLYDSGLKQKQVLLSALNTLILTILLNGIITFLFYRSVKLSLILSVIICSTILWTAGFLSVTGISVNEHILCGISISTGLIADTALVIFEILNNSSSKKAFFNRVNLTSGAAVTSTATTLIAVIPLFFMSDIISSIKNTGTSIFFMLIFSSIISLVFLPPFLPDIQKKTYSTSFLTKPILTRISIIIKKSRVLKIVFIILTASSIIIFMMSEKNIVSSETGEVFYYSIEYNPEKKIDSIKEEINAYINTLLKNEKIKYIKSTILRGKVEFEVIHSAKSNDQIADEISTCSKLIKTGTVFIPSTDKNKKHTPVTLQIAVTGDNEALCRSYAKEAAKTVNYNHLSLQTTLNFKDEEKMYQYIPSKIKLAKTNLTVFDAAQQLRFNIFNSVISKMFVKNNETDITLSSSNEKTLSSIKEINLISNNNKINILSAGDIRENTIPSQTHRLNTRPCANFSVELSKKDFYSTLKKLKSLLYSIKMNEGYKFIFPSYIKQNQSSYKKLTMIIFFCIFCIYIFLVSKNENFYLSFIILLCIPSSLFLPLLLRALSGTAIGFGDTVGIILLSGIVINNSIYISEAPGLTVYEKLSERIESILITSFTTILGSLPMMCFSNSTFVKSLSFFMTFGVLNSIAVSLFLFPLMLKDFLCVEQNKTSAL